MPHPTRFNQINNSVVVHPSLLGLLLLMMSLAIACESASPAQRAPDGEVESCGGLAPVAGLAEQCCESLGIDACGPGLFCKAYDGRTLAGCYAEHSRLDGETCAADSECLSFGCNLESGRCAASPYAPCSAEDGCGSGPSTDRFVCADGECRASSGAIRQPCGQSLDCQSTFCLQSRCVEGRVGDTCDLPEHCLSDRCVAGRCSNGNLSDICSTGIDCVSGLCVVGRCSDGSEGEFCQQSTECRSGYCVEDYCRSGALGAKCANTADCESGFNCDRACTRNSCPSTCTTGLAGAPCVSDGGCGAGLICSDDVGWPTGSTRRTHSSCATEDRCSFIQQNCNRTGEVCLRTSNSAICGRPGVGFDGLGCSADADCASGVCEDHGDGVLLCARPGGWGSPCWYRNPSHIPGDEYSSGCNPGLRCAAIISGDSIGLAYGQCGGAAGFICSITHDGTVTQRYGGCAADGLAGCRTDPYNRMQCDNEWTLVCTSDADCSGGLCVVLRYCR